MKPKYFGKIIQHPAHPRFAVGERAQSIIIIAVAFVVLLAFVGLVTDVGSIYVSWTRLKRGVDAAAIAAANNMKSSEENITDEKRLQNMTKSASEMLALNGVTEVNEMKILTCDNLDDVDGEGNPVVPPGNELIRLCSTATGNRKLAWIEARYQVDVYFLSIIGVRSYPLVLSSIGEAAMLDLVLVFDTSESMGVDTLVDPTDPTGPTVGQIPGGMKDFNPADCNSNHYCQPLQGAKGAAISLIKRMYPGFDRVAIVTFDYKAKQVFPYPPSGQTTASLGLNLNGNEPTEGDGVSAVEAIGQRILLHDDAPLARFAWDQMHCNNCDGKFNPVFPEDRDGDGRDEDVGDCTPTDDVGHPYRLNLEELLLAEAAGTVNAFLDDPVLCDLDNQYDVFDWNDDDDYSNDHAAGVARETSNGDFDGFTTVSTCIGCGVRLGKEILTQYGRPGGVWVLVVLTDGAANVSDSSKTWPAGIPNIYPSGFCTRRTDINDVPYFWVDWCKDLDNSVRYCIDSDSSTCPPGSTYTGSAWDGAGYTIQYSVVDYAKDMADETALLYPQLQPTPEPNPNEPNGHDIVMYSITFGKDADLLQKGVNLMHYIADVGDDGIRGGDCAKLDYDAGGTASYTLQCGNYYHAADNVALTRVFADIMARIYTKISQ